MVESEKSKNDLNKKATTISYLILTFVLILSVVFTAVTMSYFTTSINEKTNISFSEIAVNAQITYNADYFNTNTVTTGTNMIDSLGVLLEPTSASAYVRVRPHFYYDTTLALTTEQENTLTILNGLLYINMVTQSTESYEWRLYKDYYYLVEKDNSSSLYALTQSQNEANFAHNVNFPDYYDIATIDTESTNLYFDFTVESIQSTYLDVTTFEEIINIFNLELGEKKFASYLVMYNANGGTLATKYEIYLSGEALSAPIPTRDGYTFNGWVEASDGDAVTSNLFLTASWVANT